MSERLELLISAVDQDAETLIRQMRIQSDAVIVNQCGRDGERTLEHDGHRIREIASSDRGVGASRNLCMKHAEGDVLLFSDEDIVYEDGYAQKVLNAFDAHAEADMLLFNVIAMEGRRTYYNESYHRVTWRNCGRYPAYSIAVRHRALEDAGVTFSLLFGGGARYSNGEDSLFLTDCLKAGLTLYAAPEILGHERERESTWFHGYTEKFFFDRGVLYHFLYGRMALPFAARFLLLKRKTMCREIPVRKALTLMRQGIAQGKKEKGNTR